MGLWCYKGIGKAGVLVGLPGVCDMEWVFGVTKVLCKWGMRWVLMG